MKQHYTNPKVHKAFHALTALSEDEEARLRAEMRERALKDEISELNAARREGREEGRRTEVVDSIIMILQFRFQSVSESIQKRLTAISELELLRSIREKALAASSFEEFEKNVP